MNKQMTELIDARADFERKIEMIDAGIQCLRMLCTHDHYENLVGMGYANDHFVCVECGQAKPTAYVQGLQYDT